MNKIYTLKEYNAKAYSKYIVAVNNAIKLKNEDVPAMSKFVYQKSGGYVIADDTASKWFSNKIKANEYLVKLESEK